MGAVHCSPMRQLVGIELQEPQMTFSSRPHRPVSLDPGPSLSTPRGTNPSAVRAHFHHGAAAETLKTTPPRANALSDCRMRPDRLAHHQLSSIKPANCTNFSSHQQRAGRSTAELPADARRLLTGDTSAFPRCLIENAARPPSGSTAAAGG
jgi:hypothetical protein